MSPVWRQSLGTTPGEPHPSADGGGPMTSNQTHLQIHSDPTEMAKLQAMLLGWCGEAGLDELAAFKLTCAVVEALNNCIEHAYGGEPGNPIDLLWTRSPDAVAIEIRDQGRASSMPMAESRGNPSTSSGHGARMLLPSKYAIRAIPCLSRHWHLPLGELCAGKRGKRADTHPSPDLIYPSGWLQGLAPDATPGPCRAALNPAEELPEERQSEPGTSNPRWRRYRQVARAPDDGRCRRCTILP